MPAAADQKDTIIYSTGDSIHRYLVSEGIDSALPITNLRNIAALDYDYNNSCVYWADTELDSIQVSYSLLWQRQWCYPALFD